ncbi:AraC family transcriptional regulator (plasmid) [Embleya sp. NBC_00888]|uniref:AraC family transcriptional regulator n=1 Tax=Embleya sp. NBC_00888 TaxID=2975960 RepID=UPI002F9143DD|nr:AraC family transcriptional regulator [Embleya sp. NBC_00888]
MRTHHPIDIGIDLARHTLLRSRDPDEIVQAVTSVLRPHRLRPTSRTEPACVLQHAGIGGVSFTRLRYGQSVVIDSEPLQTCYLVSLPLAGSADYLHGSQQARATPSAATVISPHEPFRITMDAGYDQLIIRIDRRLIERARDTEACGGDRRPIGFKLGFDTASPQWAIWAPAAQALLGSDPFFDRVQRSPRLGVHMEWLLASALLEAQPNTAPCARTSSDSAAPGYVRQAEEYMRAHLAEPLTVTGIAAHAGVSTRSLYAGFKEHRGVSPMSLLRRLRLERVRQELLTAPPGAVTVTEIAIRWGFGHLGEFSAAYRRRFGETPSSSLARTH